MPRTDIGSGSRANRAQLEDALRATEERLALALSAGELATWDWDLRTGNIVWSDARYCMEGYAVGALAPDNEPLEMRVHPEDRAASTAALIEARDQRRAYRHEFRALHVDGTVHWLSAHGRYFYDNTGKPCRMIGAIRDVTERTRAELAVRASENRQAFLLELSDTLRALADPIAVQSEACRLLCERLQTDRVYYAECDSVAGEIAVRWDYVRGDAPSLVGLYPLSAFDWVWPAFREGKTVVVNDARTSPTIPEAQRPALEAIHVGSFILGPLIMDDGVIIALSVAAVAPRVWTSEEAYLVQQVVERTYSAVERARAEAALRASEARHAFLLALSDRLRTLGDPMEIQLAASRLLTEYLHVPRCFYTECDEGTATVRCEHVVGDAPSMKGVYNFSDFAAAVANLRAGEPYVASDSAVRPVSANVRRELEQRRQGGEITIPLVKRGKLVATLTVSDVVARAWTPLDVSLVQETAERTWAAVERAQAEEALRESMEWTRLAAAAARLYAWDLDIATGRLRISDEVQQAQGFDVRPDLRAGIPIACHPDDEPRVQREFADALARGDDFEIEYRRRATEAHSHRWACSTGKVIHDRSGAPIRAIAVTQDISVRKLADTLLRESELRVRALLSEETKARAASEAANRAKDEFLATLSHELRTPLAAILLWASALRSEAMPAKQLSRAIDAIVQSAKSQSQLIEDLLDLSRLTSGKFVLVRSPVDLAAVTHAAIEIVRPSAESKKIALTAHIEAGLDEVVLDGARTKQILWNLLANAVKFTPEGGHVNLTLRLVAEQLQFEVIDTGAGIAPDFMPRLFEKFSQADMAETRQYMGLGIGLALTKQLVELHGGTIEAESEGHQCGALFRVRLPFVRSEPSSESAAARTVTAVSSNSPLADLNVLVVEDDVNTRDALQWMLSRAGADVVAVPTAPEALAALSGEHEPDVIVSDLGLPGMSGYELIERIGLEYERRGKRRPPSCAVSAHARDVDRERAIDAGFDIYVAKPVTAARLIEAVADLRDIAAT
jgi:PAS domain S-box-containing protein